MRLTTRSKAMSILTANPHLTKIKLDGGKLNPDRRNDIKERDYPCGNHVKAIWLENRKDNWGPYLVLMCLADYSNEPQIVCE